MNKNELREIIGLVVLNYSNMDFPQEKINLWFEMLDDLDFQRTKYALKNLFCTLTYPPTIADIRKAYNDAGKLGNGKTAFDAVTVLTSAISQYGYTNAQKALDYIKGQDEILYRIVQGIGFRNICMSDMNYMRNEVSKIYSELICEDFKNELVQQRLVQTVKALLQDSALRIESAYV